MDSIQLNKIGVLFEKTPIFKSISFSFFKNSKYFILGRNGSGKSTLVKVISGLLEPSTGDIRYINNHAFISPNAVFPSVSIASPYLNLFEEFTLEEHVRFHFSFKSPIQNLTLSSVLEKVDLPGHHQKRVALFSSGMKQKVKLALAILSETPILLLDEPCSNLDQKNTEWYQDLISQYGGNRITIIASNHDEREVGLCTDGINMS